MARRPPSRSIPRLLWRKARAHPSRLPSRHPPNRPIRPPRAAGADRTCARSKPGGGTADTGRTPVAADVAPLYRSEVAAYTVVLPVAHELAMTTLGTFHDRRGEQSLLRGGDGILPATWGGYWLNIPTGNGTARSIPV